MKTISTNSEMWKCQQSLENILGVGSRADMNMPMESQVPSILRMTYTTAALDYTPPAGIAAAVATHSLDPLAKAVPTTSGYTILFRSLTSKISGPRVEVTVIAVITG